jgi:hypothetical protein
MEVENNRKHSLKSEWSFEAYRGRSRQPGEIRVTRFGKYSVGAVALRFIGFYTPNSFCFSS